MADRDLRSHLVHHQLVEVELRGRGAWALEEVVRRVCTERLSSALEAVFDTWAPGPVHHRIERLELDLGVFRSSRLEHDLPERVREAFARALQAPSPILAAAPERTDDSALTLEVLTPETSDEVLLRIFLDTGALPWWSERLSGGELEGRLMARLARPGRVTEWICEPAGADRRARRVLGQFSQSAAQALLAAVARDAGVNEILEAVREAMAAREVPTVTWERALLDALLPAALASTAASPLSAEAVVAAALATAAALGVGVEVVAEALARTLPTPLAARLPALLLGSAERERAVAVHEATHDAEASDEVLLRIFLDTGALPWRSEHLSGAALEGRLMARLARPGRVTEWICEPAGADRRAQRVLGQFSQPAARALLAAVARDAGVNEILEAVHEAMPAREVTAVTWERALLDALLPAALASTAASPLSAEAVVTAALASAAALGVGVEVAEALARTLPTQPAARLPAPLPGPAQRELAVAVREATRDSPRAPPEAPDVTLAATHPLPSRRLAETSTLRIAVPDVGRLLAHGLPVDNAGLVLLHPFLKTFFAAVGLLAGKDFRDDAARCRAVCLLQWLAHEDGAEDEHRMLLSKVLCGVPPDEVVPRSDGLTDNEREEGEALLQHVVTSWTALKKTSVRGLREAFLRRDGMLRTHASGWLLRFEAKAWDLLLDQLPWGISHVRLPWMTGLLQVER